MVCSPGSSQCGEALLEQTGILELEKGTGADLCHLAYLQAFVESETSVLFGPYQMDFEDHTNARTNYHVPEISFSLGAAVHWEAARNIESYMFGGRSIRLPGLSTKELSSHRHLGQLLTPLPPAAQLLRQSTIPPVV